MRLARINVLLQLYKMRDWRLVEAEDATGVKRICLLLPCLQNGIRFNKSQMPYISFLGRKSEGDFENRYGYMLTPYITNKMHEEMLQKGVSAIDDKHWAPVVGNVKTLNYGYKDKDNG